MVTLEEHLFKDGATPIVVLEPAGLPWIIVAAYLHAQYPDCRLVKAKTQKVAVLRKYLKGPAKSDRIDALTLAKMPFIDPEQMEEMHLPSAEILALQRLTKQRKRLERDISARKVRIEAILEGYVLSIHHITLTYDLQKKTIFGEKQ